MKKRTKFTALIVLCVICLSLTLVVLCACEKGDRYVFESIEYLIDTEEGVALVRQFYGGADDNGRVVREIPAYVVYKGVEYPVVSLNARSYFYGEPDPIVSGGNITDLIVPETVRSIGIGGFNIESLQSLERIIVHPDNPAYKSIDGVLYSKDGKELIYKPLGRTAATFVITKELETIREYSNFSFDKYDDIYVETGNTEYKSIDGALYTFDGSSLLHYSRTRQDATLTIGWNVNKIATRFDNKYLQNIEVDERNALYKSVDGVLYDKQANALLCYPAGRQDTSFVVPSNITRIKSGAISGEDLRLKSIYIPSFVWDIEYGAISADVTIYTDAYSVSDFWKLNSSQKSNVQTSVTLAQFVELMQQNDEAQTEGAQ